MRRIAALCTLFALGLPAGSLFADAVGAPDIPEPVDASSGTTSAGRDKAVAPIAIESTTVTAPAPATKPAAPAATPVAPAPASPEPTVSEGRTGYRAPTPKPAFQTHSAYLVNRVVVELPAGVRVVTRKDWYTDKVTISYPAGTHANWRGVVPEPFVFTHDGTTLKVTASGINYVPKEIVITVRPSTQVQVQ